MNKKKVIIMGLASINTSLLLEAEKFIRTVEHDVDSGRSRGKGKKRKDWDRR